jgi:formylglycine-generating enzyme required for sulfatase activity
LKLRLIVIIITGIALITFGYSIFNNIEKQKTVEHQIRKKVRLIDGMTMIYIPAGEFEMGSTFLESIVFSNGKLFLFPDQRPKHTIYLDAYWIDQTEVTVRMFNKFVEETGYRTDAEKEGWGKPWTDGPKDSEWPKIEGIDWLHPRDPDSIAQDSHPVVQVSWRDAMAYCEWVGGSLPTEAQWEKAARGVDGRRFPWGDSFNGNYLNYGDKQCPVERWRDLEFDDGYAYTAPVGSYPKGASPYGVLDMAGNVWEWTYDWYDENYYEVSPDRNPTGPESGGVRSMRGGAWYDGEPEGWVNCIIRHQNPSNDRYEDVGFRCMLPADKMKRENI